MRTSNSAMGKRNLPEEDFKLYHQLLYRGKGLHVAERESKRDMSPTRPSGAVVQTIANASYRTCHPFLPHQIPNKIQ